VIINQFPQGVTMPETACASCECSVSEADLLLQYATILDDYRETPGALIPVLQIAQKLFGYLPESVLRMTSEKLDKPYSEVAGVVSFYSFFSTTPRGKNLIRVCLGTACYVRGGKEVLDALKKQLKIDVGETTDDRLFSLDVGRCFGACGLAPVIMVNDDVHQRVKPSKIPAILGNYRESETSERKGND
jgi:NADH:ubiquinone oxidoreductase subunit E